MGWNKSMLVDDEVEITFNFTDTRLFQHVDIHTNNMFTKDVQVNRRFTFNIISYANNSLQVLAKCLIHLDIFVTIYIFMYLNSHIMSRLRIVLFYFMLHYDYVKC